MHLLINSYLICLLVTLRSNIGRCIYNLYILLVILLVYMTRLGRFFKFTKQTELSTQRAIWSLSRHKIYANKSN